MQRKYGKNTTKIGGKGSDINVYTGTFKPGELEKLRRALAKRANQRIVRLERASSHITGESFSDFGAITYAREYLKERKRFSEQKDYMKGDFNSLRREITVLQSFLGSKSSTVKGMRDIENKRIKAFETGKWGKLNRIDGQTRRRIEFASTKEFYEFLNSSTFHALVKSGFTSEQVVELYDQARMNFEGRDEEVIRRMEDALEAYREGQKISLKDIEQRLGMREIK